MVLQVPEGEKEGEGSNQEVWMVGKVLTQGSFNSKAFMTTMAQVWKTRGGVEIHDVGRNLFTFKFHLEGDRCRVTTASPWSFDRKLIILQDINRDNNPREMALTHCAFWVRV